VKARFGDVVVELVQGDVAAQRVDAIVNAANSGLLGGGGVDGAIHDAGGPAIMAETRTRYPGGCPTGQAVASGAGELSARYVIHAVGPIYRDGSAGEAALLASAYTRSLRLAAELGCDSVALPALSTGAYGYPLGEAARIALTAAKAHALSSPLPRRMRFVLFDRRALAEFSAGLAELVEPPRTDARPYD
jgi:O-acetyl-ADP-ribose deacetylase (regulator of RNase III)